MKVTLVLQRRLGLYVASAAEANGTLAAAGGEPDWLGDALCNGGEHGTRHHAVNRAWQRALAAVATGSVLLGDKEEKDKYKMYNEGYVPDLVRPGASAWGTDWIGESKVASPLTKAGPGVLVAPCWAAASAARLARRTTTPRAGAS